jgi:hypothetical protein
MNVEKLIIKGYFPEEITPAFVTEDLKKVLPVILSSIDIYQTINGKAKITKLLRYSSPKIKAYRRNIVIPNPLSIIRLSKTIADHWNEIVAFTNKSSISLSPLKENTTSIRSLAQPSFDLISDQRILRSTGFRFGLKIDVLRFYGNIYTHSIPWVLHGKSLSKSRRKRTELLGNALDEDVRNMQDAQTIGIPIGPDTSRVISEIIAAYIDIELEKQLPGIKGIRVVDDYTLYFKSLGELESARSIVLKLLRDIELDLNQAKESVIELPEQIEAEWYNRLRDFKFRNEYEYQHKDLIAYFDLSFFYSKKYPNESILTYSLSKIAATVFKKQNWEILESFLLKSLLIDSKCLPYVTTIFISHKNEEYNLNLHLIKGVLEDLISFHLSLDNHYEVSWSLWLIKQLGIEISENIAKQLSCNNNSIIVLTTLDLYNSGFIPVGLDSREWQKLLTVENLYTEHWLLVYEALKKGWLTSTTDVVGSDLFFSLLRRHDVEFYQKDKLIDMSKVKVTSEKISLLKYRDEVEDEDLDEDEGYDHSRDEQDSEISHKKNENWDKKVFDDDLPF